MTGDVAEVAGALQRRALPLRDAESRISDTRVRCMPAVAKRGCTRLVALVTTARPVHDRTLTRETRALARRLGAESDVDVDQVMAIRRIEWVLRANLPGTPTVSTAARVRGPSDAPLDK